MVRLGSEGLTSSIKYLSFPNQRQVLHTKIHHEILVPCSQKFAMLLRLVAQFPDLVSQQNLAYVLNLYGHFFGFVEEFCKQFDNPMEIYLNLYQLYLTSALREKDLHKLTNHLLNSIKANLGQNIKVIFQVPYQNFSLKESLR